MYRKNLIILFSIFVFKSLIALELNDFTIVYTSFFPTNQPVKKDFVEKENLFNLVEALKKRVERRSNTHQEFVKYLKQSSRFSKVMVSLQNKTITLKPRIFIKKITIENYQPFFLEEIFKILPIKDYSYIDNPAIFQTEKLLQSFFIKNSFLDCKIKSSITKLNQDSEFDIIELKFTILKNKNYYQIGTIDFKGNNYFSNFRLRTGLKLFKSKILGKLLFSHDDAFQEKFLQQDLQKLKRLYLQSGFGRVEITSSIEKDTVNYKKNIHINITEGPQIFFKFTGNQDNFTSNLQEIIDNSNKNIGNERMLYSILAGIKKFYNKQGYINATINYDKKEAEKEEIYTIKINEGELYLVDKIILNSNFFSMSNNQDNLNDYLTLKKGLPFSSKILMQDMNNLKNFLISKGFNDVQIKDSVVFIKDKKNTFKSNIIINFTNTDSKKIKKINFISQVKYLYLKDKLQLKEQGTFSEVFFHKDIEMLKNELGKLGFPYAEVKADFKYKDNDFFITYELEPNIKIQENKTFIFGLNKSNDDDILFYKNKIKNKFSLINLYHFQNKVRSLKTYKASSFKVIGLNEKDSLLDQIIYLEEIEPYFLHLNLGYYSDIGFLIKGKIGDRIFLHGDRTLSLEAEYSKIRQGLALKLTQFRFSSQELEQTYYSILKKELEESAEWENYYDISTGIKLGYFFCAKIFLDLDFGYSYRRVKTLQNSEKLSSLYAKSGITLDYRDKALRPKKGWKFRVGTEYNHNLRNSLKHYIQLKSNLSGYFTPFKQLTLASHVACYSYLHDNFKPFLTQNSNHLSSEKLYYGGGLSDIRGYSYHNLYLDNDNQKIGGYHFLFGNLELRYEFYKDFEIALFNDFGLIKELSTKVVSTKNFKKSIGLAFRYLTLVGPIGLAYGYKLDRNNNEDRGAFHFHIGYNF